MSTRHFHHAFFLILVIIVLATLLLFASTNTSILSPTGGVVTRVAVLQLIPSSCNLTLSSGWNMVSYPCLDIGGTSPSNFLFDVSNKTPTMHTYVSSDVYDPWKAYNPNLPNWVVQDMGSILAEKGYWLYVNDTGSIIINSTITTPAFISVSSGWNLVGYPTLTSLAVNNSLATIYPYWQEILYYNSTSLSYLSFDNSTQTGDFSDMQPYPGYWLYLTESGTWVISW